MDHRPPFPEELTDDLPGELLEKLAEREIGTLENYRQWLDELIAHKRKRLGEKELPTMAVSETSGEKVLTALSLEDRSNVETRELLGRFVWQFIACDSDRCGCTSGRPADLHGPYLRRQYIDGSGHRTAEYIPESDHRQELVRRLAPKPAPEDAEVTMRE